MHITVLQENLRAALSIVSKAVPSRASLPILNTILITADATGVTLAATDLYVGMTTTVAAVTEQPGSAAIPARLLVETVTSLPAGKLNLEISESTLTISSAESELKVSCQDSAEFPAFPVVAATTQETPLALWEQALREVGFAVGTDPNRVLLSAILLESREESTRLVATDGFRLAVNDLPTAVLAGTESLLVPARAVGEVVRIANQHKAEKVSFAVDHNLKQLLFRLGSTQMYVRLIEGEYPPYQKIMPSEFEVEATWDTTAFVEHLKRALIFGRESSYVVRMRISEKELEITSRGATAGEYHGTLPAKLLKGSEGKIAFNAKYVLDLLSNVQTSQIWFGMSDPLKPALFRPADRPEYSYVVMPFRTND